MCYPGCPSISLRDLEPHRRWIVLERAMVVPRAPETGQAPRVVNEAAAQGGGGGSGGLKRCVCSPTRHPKSFRCRYHHDEYVWSGGGGGSLIQAATIRN
ncbi:hypothetical protein Acr_00g0071660 [Actinidia rufa]|uniref:Uncharacterized protein n=1 Tax=Actinidia rufa TaxID=165716 RepID=A0A7J0DRT6_9ERIC|nr:hypothetical protein Acr_00g0071660 [Actinidia rufa]